MKIKDIINNKMIAVYCRTNEEIIKLLQVLDDMNFCWQDNTRANQWRPRYVENYLIGDICLDVTNGKIAFQYFDYYHKNGYKIIDFKKLELED